MTGYREIGRKDALGKANKYKSKRSGMGSTVKKSRWFSVMAVAVFVLAFMEFYGGSTLRAQAAREGSLGEAMGNSDLYGTRNFTTSGTNPSNYALPDTKSGWFAELEKLGKTLDNLAHGNVNGDSSIPQGSGTHMNDTQENPYYNPGNSPEIDTGVGATGNLGNYYIRAKSVEASLNALGNDPGYESETGYAIRNGVHGGNIGLNLTGISTENPVTNAAIGYASGKATQYVDSKEGVDAINNFTRDNEVTRQTDQMLRTTSADAKIDLGATDDEVNAYIHGGNKEYEARVESNRQKEAYLEARYQQAKEDARMARWQDAIDHGRYEEAEAIMNGKEREYWEKVRNATDGSSSSSTANANGLPNEKPNIYLYPDEETVVLVNFAYPEKLTRTIPEYETGWKVTAGSDGTLFHSDTAKKYGFLFYEGTVEPFYFQRKQGFLLPADKREETFRKILPRYGLKLQEIDDFVEYWVDRLPAGVTYVMYPQLNEIVDQMMPVSINPEPDSILRLWFLYEDYEGAKAEGMLTDISETDGITEFGNPQPLPFERNGFTVVEWGGSVW